MKPSRHALKPIRFGDEPLPDWAQLLDLAARLCEVPGPTQQWFSLVTSHSGVCDASTVTEHCQRLHAELLERRDLVLVALAPGSGDSEPATIVSAWLYALDTMIQVAANAKTCTWHVHGTEDSGTSDFSDGDITLRRI